MAAGKMSPRLSDAIDAYMSASKVYKDHVASRKLTSDFEGWYETVWFLYELVQSCHLEVEEARLELLLGEHDQDTKRSDTE